MNVRDKTSIGEQFVKWVQRYGMDEQGALALVLTCLRWYAKHAALSFSQAVDESWTLMVHDRVNRKEDS
jgi:hypothetical protein